MRLQMRGAPARWRRFSFLTKIQPPASRRIIINLPRLRLFMGKSMFKKLAAEFLGTFVLVFGGCGSALYPAA